MIERLDYVSLNGAAIGSMAAEHTSPAAGHAEELGGDFDGEGDACDVDSDRVKSIITCSR